MKRYETTIGDETFLITEDYNSIGTYEIFLVTPRGLSQSEDDFSDKTQDYINMILGNIQEYTTPENEIHPDYKYLEE